MSVGYSFYLIYIIMQQPDGNHKMKEIAAAIQAGSKAFLIRQYKTIAIVALVLLIAIWKFLGDVAAWGFLFGAFMSGLVGFLSMFASVRSNVRVAQAAEHGLKRAFDLSIKGGAVTGFLVVGLGLLSILVVYTFAGNDSLVHALLGLSFGSSLISVFARLGGGIYTKAADVGADLVGKVEAGIPEDDPRNPATIADNVGDNVGDCAGMAADLFETYVVTITAAILLSKMQFPGYDQGYILSIAGAGVLASLIGVMFIKLKGEKIMSALYKGLWASVAIAAVLFYFIADKFFVNNAIYSPLKIWGALLTGLFVSSLLMLVTDYYTSCSFKPVQNLAKASSTGHGTNIIEGLALSLESCILPTVIILAGIWVSYSFVGIYGVALASLGMLSIAGMIVAIDAYGPITDNAGGIAEMSDMPKDIRKTTDALDAVGNTTKAVTKGYAIGSAALASLTLFSLYNQEVQNLLQKSVVINFSEPEILIGLLLGGLLPYAFGSLAMRAVGKTAQSVVIEVRRQFKELPGIMEYKTKPDYGKCVDVVTKAALKEMVLPAILPVLVTVLVGFILGRTALMGVLIGSLVTGLFVAISMTTGGAAWDNAKKYIEKGNYGGKGSQAHAAAVTGDTVGDPYKDTAGPAINPMLKVINIVALLVVSLL